MIFLKMEYHVLQDDTTYDDTGIIYTWDDYSCTHDALAAPTLKFDDFFEAALAKFLLANDIPDDKKDCYMAILAFEGDARNVGLIDADKSRFETMKTDKGYFQNF